MKVFPFEYKKNLISNIKFLEKNKEDLYDLFEIKNQKKGKATEKYMLI